LSLLAFGLLPAAAGAFNHAKFDIVIEGQSLSLRNFTLSGQASVCEENLHGTFIEETTFLRGKGVTIEFVRKKVGGAYEYGARRLGAAAAITVVASTKRKASGEQTFKRAANAPLVVQCPEEGTKDLSTVGECEVAHTTREPVSLKIVGNAFAIVQEGESLASPHSGKPPSTKAGWRSETNGLTSRPSKRTRSPTRSCSAA
jgi:hypothetical protein